MNAFMLSLAVVAIVAVEERLDGRSWLGVFWSGVLVLVSLWTILGLMAWIGAWDWFWA